MKTKGMAVIVGATGEMGQLISARLVGLGLKVVLVARTGAALEALVTRLQERFSGNADILGCVADIAQDRALDTIAATVDRAVDIVVHGPGVATAGGILTAPPAALAESVNIKAGGFVRLVRAVEAELHEGSRLVAIGGHYGFEPNAYAATAGVANAALANIVRQVSLAYGPRGITAHLIAPGPADTSRLRRVAAARAERDGLSVEDVLSEMQQESAIGRFTNIEDVAWAVEMLLSPHADSLAGSTLFMDAGRRKGLP